MNKVLLLVANSRTVSLVSPTVSLFYSILKANGIDMRFFDTTVYKSPYTDLDKYKESNLVAQNVQREKELKTSLFSDLREEVKSFKPDVIFASCMESTFLYTIELLKSIRDFKLPHVLGGIFPTFAPEVVFKYKEVDIVCVGEGEKVIAPLVQKLARGEKLDLPNIWTRDSKSTLEIPVNLDELPRFDASIYEDSRFYRSMAGKLYKMFPVETHRGCPFRCAFCNSPLQTDKYLRETGKPYFRKKSIKKIMEDIEYFVECGAEYLFFWADNFFSYSKDEIDEFCKRYEHIKIPFYAQSYPSTLDEYKLKRLLEVGLNRIGIGIEHGNERFRSKMVNRRYSNEEAIAKINVLKKYRVQFSLNNIVGFPDETPELHQDTIEINRILEPYTSGISIFTPFHGIPLREHAVKKGYISDDVIAPSNTGESILNMPQFTKKEISAKARTFNLYVKLPKNRWDEIRRAEYDNFLWAKLKQEAK